MNLRKYYNRKRLTLDEMCSIFMSDTYKDFRERCNLSVKSLPQGKKFVPVINGWPCTDVSPLLYRHIVAEQLLQGDYHKIDWDIVYDRCRYFAMLELWFRPLEWVDSKDYPDIVTEGRIAREKYNRERPLEINELLNYINECSLLDFADNIYTFTEDSYDTGHMKGMHEWGRLTTDDSEIFGKIINGGHATYEEIVSCKYYDIGNTRAGLIEIAEKRGGKRAAELLHMLQDEWPKIKLWKTYFDTMSPEDIEQFEFGLFHAFDDLLAEWEKDKKQTPTRGPKETTLFKDAETEEREKKRFTSFIKQHKMKDNDVDATLDNLVNQVAVCFYREWQKRDYLKKRAEGTSLTRFIKDCGLSISVREKAHANKLNMMIKSEDYFTDWLGIVKESFVE